MNKAMEETIIKEVLRMSDEIENLKFEFKETLARNSMQLKSEILKEIDDKHQLQLKIEKFASGK